MHNNLMTASEVAELFGNSVSTIYNWRDKGIITPRFKSPSGRGDKYDANEIQALYNKSLIFIPDNDIQSQLKR